MNTFIKTHLTVPAVTAALITAILLTGYSGNRRGEAVRDDLKDLSQQLDTATNTDIDLDSLDQSAKAIGDLDLDTDVKIDVPDTTPPSFDDEASSDTGKSSSGEPAGDKTVYSYTDVYRDGNDLTVVPNGGLNGSTVFTGGKDLKGFLDYVDDEVLEKGRTINRDFFYDVLSTMLVDKDLTPDFDAVENNMLMALAIANEFHDTDVRINDCYLDANNASEYHYHVTVYGEENTWIVDYGKRTMYLNDGATEYSSTMFDNENLAVWMTAIELYYK